MSIIIADAENIIADVEAYLKFFGDLKKRGWEVNGSLGSILDLEKAPKDSQLSARVRLECKGVDDYELAGVLQGPNVERIGGIYRRGAEIEVLGWFKRFVYGTCEAYSNRMTNRPEIKEVHDKYVIVNAN